MKNVRTPPKIGIMRASQLCQFLLMLVPCTSPACRLQAQRAWLTTGFLMRSTASLTVFVTIPG